MPPSNSAPALPGHDSDSHPKDQPLRTRTQKPAVIELPSLEELEHTLRRHKLDIELLQHVIRIEIIDRTRTRVIRKRAHPRIHKNQPVYLEERTRMLRDFIKHLNAIRQPDLIAISGIDNATFLKTVQPALLATGKLVQRQYAGDQPGRAPFWWEWQDRRRAGPLTAHRRSELKMLGQLMRTYRVGYWQAEAAAGRETPPAFTVHHGKRSAQAPHAPRAVARPAAPVAAPGIEQAATTNKTGSTSVAEPQTPVLPARVPRWVTIEEERSPDAPLATPPAPEPVAPPVIPVPLGTAKELPEDLLEARKGLVVWPVVETLEEHNAWIAKDQERRIAAIRREQRKQIAVGCVVVLLLLVWAGIWMIG